MRLPVACPFDLLAVGGQLKNTFALGAGAHAFLSQHMGDLDDYSAYQAFERDIELYQRTWRVTPRMIAHDLHPDYASTRYAQRRAEQTGERCMAVQHHHAHMASCLAEHGLTGPVIGVCFDGTGYGTDGAVWGGEFLVGDCATFRRGAHLRYVPMPGGEQAVREPWRMAAAHLLEAGCPLETLEPRVPARSLRTIETLIEHGLNAPRTSSMGRLFDAAAALVGIRGRVSYEGQAAMQLEWLAEGHRAEGCYPFEIIDGSGEMCVVDPRPLVRAVCEDLGIREPGEIARRFHATVAEIVRQVCVRLHAQTGLDRVVLSGGVFMNVLLTTDVVDRLNAENFTVYRHERVPPNDGGLSLGQLAVAVARVAPQRTMRNNTTDSMTNVGS
jgi:hydrogenase maturation protein HypF